MPASNGVKVVAIAGAGQVGGPLLEDFLSAGIPTKLLTRDASKPELAKYKSQGAELITVDYSSLESLQAALSGVDAVISTLSSSTGEDVQTTLAKAAKAAGVKLFLPTEFGLDYDKALPLHPFTQDKPKFVETLKELKLPYFLITNSLFAEFIIHPIWGFDVPNRKFPLPIKSDAKFSYTALADIATFTRLSVLYRPIPQPGQGERIKVESGRATFDQLLAQGEKLDGKKWSITRKTDFSKDEENAKQPDIHGFAAWVAARIGDSSGLHERVDHDAVGFKPKVTFEDVLKKQLAA